MRCVPDWLIHRVFGEWPDRLSEIHAFEDYWFDPESDYDLIEAVEEYYGVAHA